MNYIELASQWRRVRTGVRIGGIVLSAILVATSTTFLFLSREVAPWFGWALNLGLIAALIGFVMQLRGLATARYAFWISACLCAFGAVGSVMAVV